MRRAIILSAFGDHPPLTTDEIEGTLAGRFDIDCAILEAKHAGHDTFFVFVNNEATTARMVGAGPFTGAGGPRLHLRRWTRQAFASGTALPSLVDVELRGITAHAWEMSTVENLLNPYAWPQQLHPATRNWDDYSVFRLSAWCFQPDFFPGSRDLHIVERSSHLPAPSTRHRESQHCPIWFLSRFFRSRAMAVRSPVSHPGATTRRRRQRCDAPSSPSAVGASNPRAPPLMRTSIHSRLGPVASNTQQEAAVVEADGGVASNAQQEVAIVEADDGGVAGLGLLVGSMTLKESASTDPLEDARVKTTDDVPAYVATLLLPNVPMASCLVDASAFDV